MTMPEQEYEQMTFEDTGVEFEKFDRQGLIEEEKSE